MHVLQVELVVDEVAGQPVEQFRVRRRVGRVHVLRRIDDADAEVMMPEAVHQIPREVRIVGRAHPLPQRDARVGAVLRHSRRPARRESWADTLPASRRPRPGKPT